MRRIPLHDPDHAPIRWDHLVRNATRQPDPNDRNWTAMPNGWFVYQGPRLVTVRTYQQREDGAHLTGTEQVDHATLLRLLWDRMDHINRVVDGGAWSKGASGEYFVLSAAFDLVESDLVTGSSLASWRGPRELVDMALTLASTHASDDLFVSTEWEEF
jgi:hypothetical protein